MQWSVVFCINKILIDLVALVKTLLVEGARVLLFLMELALGVRLVELSALTGALRILVRLVYG
jgi:hypothetical protein